MNNFSTSSSGNTTHKRINTSLTSQPEKKALEWLAARMPVWDTPDKLTTFGMLGSCLIFIGYLLTRQTPVYLWLASLGFVVQWFGDSLDGTLARFRKIERPRYGYFIDHIIDTVSTVMIFAGFGLSGLVRFDLAMLAAVVYLLLSIYVYLATHTMGLFRISYLRLGPTEMRLVAILANSLVFFIGNPGSGLSLQGIPLTFYDLVAGGFAVLGTIVFVVSTTTTAISLALADAAARQAVAPVPTAKARHKRAGRGQAKPALLDSDLNP